MSFVDNDIYGSGLLIFSSHSRLCLGLQGLLCESTSTLSLISLQKNESGADICVFAARVAKLFKSFIVPALHGLEEFEWVQFLKFPLLFSYFPSYLLVLFILATVTGSNYIFCFPNLTHRLNSRENFEHRIWNYSHMQNFHGARIVHEEMSLTG